ncbi:MAG: hypothetical protein IJW28_03050, partial [Clostridia bacterium]|nr:hypothetical protein [Clostridia bacterium]
KVEVNTTLNGQTASSTIDKLGSTEVNYGSEFNLEIVVNNGYILQNVYVDGMAQDDLVDKLAGTYTLTIPSVTKDTNIEVVTIKDTYTVSVGSGVVIADGVNTVSYKGEKTIYVAVTNSTDLVTLTVDNVTLNANDVMFNSDESRYEYTITNITKDIAVVAETKASHNLYTFVVGEAGGITVAPKNGRNTVATGEDKVYKLTLSEDYHIYSIKVSDGQNATNVELNSLIATEDGYLLNIENITSNLDIVVTIATGSYKITIESGANGKTLPENEVGVSYPGESKIIVFYPDEYYTIDYVEIDGDQDNRLSISDLSIDAYGNYYYEFENIFANHTLKVEFKLVEYTITINTRGSGICGTMTSTSTTITYGQTLDYDLVINEGYVLVKLLKDGVAQDGYNDLAHGNYEYTLSNVTSDVVFDLYFADSTYDINISVNNGTMGSVNTGNTTTVGYGNDFTFEFTANDGYILKDVLLDSESVIDMVEDNKYTLSNITESYNLEVIFEVKRTITINLNDSSAGYINVGTGEYDVVDGSTQNIGIFVNYGYMIESIVVDGENVDDIDSMLNTEDGGYYYTIASVTKDYVIDVTLVKTTYSVMVTKTSGGNVTPYSINAISVNYGHAVSFVMTPYTNYVLKSIVINGEDYTDLCTNDSGVYTYVITSVKQDYVVEISFATSVNNIVFNITGSGAVTPAPNGNVIEIPFNASKLVTFTADIDYVIGSLTIDGVTETNAIGKTEYYYSFTRVQEGHIVNVAFVPSKYSVDVTSNANGSTNKDGANEVDFNATLDIVITPDSGYVISEILVNTETYDLDELISSDEGLVLRLENINTDYVIEVSFDVSYTVELNANIESAVVIEGERVVLVGSSHEYVIRVNDGYMITNITIDSIAINPIEIYDATNDCYIVEFTNINENHVVDITLVQTGYGITITATDGGHTSEIGTVIVDYAGSKDVIITPDSHYHVTSVKLDGVEILQDLVLSDGAYTVTITNVVSDRTLDVKFELDSVHVELVINNTYGGYVIPSTSVTLKYGESQSYEINVYEDYVLAEVKINDTESVDLESIRLNLRKYQYNFGSVTSNQKIEITFAKAKYYMQNTASQGGSISASASVNYNEDYMCYITPNANYDILAVNVNGVDIDLNTLKVDEIGTYIEFNGVKQNYTIRDSFTLQTFNISVNIENASYGNVDYA